MRPDPLRPAALVGAALLATLLAAPAWTPALAQASGGPVLRISTPFPFTRLDPMLEIGNFYVFGAGELLMRFEPDGEIVPWVLAGLENVDETHWRMSLRPDVTFQNGTPLTAEALAAMLTYVVANSSAAQGYFPSDSTFEVTGESEVTFSSETPFPALPGLLADRFVMPVFDLQAYMAAPDTSEGLAGLGLLTAPYTIESISDDRMVLTRNENYWQGEPALAGVTVEFVRDTNASVLALQNGELDIASFMPLAIKPLVDATPGLHFQDGGADRSLFRYYQAFMNVAESPLDDPQVRFALIDAIDYEEIAEVVFEGVYGVANGFYAPLHPFALANQATDTAEAERLLDAAGWTPGADGLRQRDGETLELVALYNPGLADLTRMGTAMQDQLRRVGIGFSLVPVDDAYTAVYQMDWDLALYAHSTTAVPETFLHRHVTPEGDRNFAGYSNDEINALVDALTVTIPEDERNAILVRIQEILMEEDPYIFNLAFFQNPLAVTDAYAHVQPGFDLRLIDWQTAPGK